MANIFYDDKANLDVLEGKTVSIIGFGSQGHAHALNLKESGVNVVVGLRDGSSTKQKAESKGLEVKSVAEATKVGDLIAVLIQLPFMNNEYNDLSLSIISVIGFKT